MWEESEQKVVLLWKMGRKKKQENLWINGTEVALHFASPKAPDMMSSLDHKIGRDHNDF
jgi:hypothetical protein